MSAVLGLSMTPTAVGLVLVDGDGADGTTKIHDTFEMRRGGYSQVTTSAFVAEALSRARALADGQHVQSIGITWSDDAAVEASLLLDSLMESGFDNIVPVRLPEATEAFARGIGRVIGTDVTAVCVVEPDIAAVLVVNPIDYRAQTTERDQLQSNDDLVDWLAEVLEREGWQSDALVLLGSVGELAKVARRMEHILGIPAFAPAEGDLALARGAALASTKGPFDAAMVSLARPSLPAAPAQRSRLAKMWLKQTGPIAMLAAGVVTFVVSTSLAVGIETLPDRSIPTPSAPTHHISNTAEVQTVKTPPIPAHVPTPDAPVTDEPVLSETTPTLAPEDVTGTDAGQPVTDPVVAETPVDTPAESSAVDPAPAAEPVSETQPQADGQNPPLLTRVLQRLPGLQGDTAPTS